MKLKILRNCFGPFRSSLPASFSLFLCLSLELARSQTIKNSQENALSRSSIHSRRGDARGALRGQALCALARSRPALGHSRIVVIVVEPWPPLCREAGR